MLSNPRAALRPNDIGLILSYKCQSACRHCLYNCGPGWVDWMSLSDCLEALKMIKTLGDSVQVHITGGEPFLNYPLLLRTVKIAAGLALPRYVETNAGWCTDPDVVEDRFLELRQAGLQAILISCSPFHAEGIPLKRTLLAIDSALRVFGPQRVMVYLPEWIDQIMRIDKEAPVPLDYYLAAFGEGPAGVMFWDGFGLISGGRAGYRLGFLTDRHTPEVFQGDHCKLEILYAHHSHFDLYGNYISGFCGGLSIGSWHELEIVVSKFRREIYPPLIKVLIEEGPYGLFLIAREVYGYIPNHEGYAGKCHLCVDVRRHLVACGNFKELIPLQFYDSIYV